jgi:hypothetical protein
VLPAVSCAAEKAADKAADKALAEAAQGTWSCTRSQESDSVSYRVVVGNGTYQATGPAGAGSAGTWKRNGDTVTITENRGDEYALIGLPDVAGDSASFKITKNNSRTSDSTATYDGTTLRFDFNDVTIQCTRA